MISGLSHKAPIDDCPASREAAGIIKSDAIGVRWRRLHIGVAITLLTVDRLPKCRSKTQGHVDRRFNLPVIVVPDRCCYTTSEFIVWPSAMDENRASCGVTTKKGSLWPFQNLLAIETIEQATPPSAPSELPA